MSKWEHRHDGLEEGFKRNRDGKIEDHRSIKERGASMGLYAQGGVIRNDDDIPEGVATTWGYDPDVNPAYAPSHYVPNPNKFNADYNPMLDNPPINPPYSPRVSKPHKGYKKYDPDEDPLMQPCQQHRHPKPFVPKSERPPWYKGSFFRYFLLPILLGILLCSYLDVFQSSLLKPLPKVPYNGTIDDYSHRKNNSATVLETFLEINHRIATVIPPKEIWQFSYYFNSTRNRLEGLSALADEAAFVNRPQDGYQPISSLIGSPIKFKDHLKWARFIRNMDTVPEQLDTDRYGPMEGRWWEFHQALGGFNGARQHVPIWKAVAALSNGSSPADPRMATIVHNVIKYWIDNAREPFRARARPRAEGAILPRQAAEEFVSDAKQLVDAVQMEMYKLSKKDEHKHTWVHHGAPANRQEILDKAEAWAKEMRKLIFDAEYLSIATKRWEERYAAIGALVDVLRGWLSQEETCEWQRTTEEEHLGGEHPEFAPRPGCVGGSLSDLSYNILVDAINVGRKVEKEFTQARNRYNHQRN